MMRSIVQADAMRQFRGSFRLRLSRGSSTGASNRPLRARVVTEAARTRSSAALAAVADTHDQRLVPDDEAVRARCLLLRQTRRRGSRVQGTAAALRHAHFRTFVIVQASTSPAATETARLVPGPDLSELPFFVQAIELV